MAHEYEATDMTMDFYGVKDIDLLKKFFLEIKNNRKLINDLHSFEIKELNFYSYMDEEDHHGDIFELSSWCTYLFVPTRKQNGHNSE